ncbi:MAG: RNA ligase partner protein [Candidatus Micrarchaeota archaeon]|nr:RNA ligase partner protein [Candidatus Micrarchaeota archaeon]
MVLTRRFVLDTSLFVNPHAREKFGKTPPLAVKSFIKMISKLDAEFYMPSLIFMELKNFIGEKISSEFELHIKKRAPNIYALYLPAAVLHDFIEDVRGRMNKGLRLAEEYAQDNKPENNVKLQKLREKYRDAVRAGLLDSKEDFELVMLAKELEATLVSSDEGVLKFANKVGCEWLNGSKMFAMLKKMKK